MKKFLLAVILVLMVSTMASAAQWVTVYENEDLEVYFDIDSIKHNQRGDGSVTLWQKWIYNARHPMIRGERVAELKEYVTYNSNERDKKATRSQQLGYNVFGTLVIRYSGPQIDNIVPDTIGEALWLKAWEHADKDSVSK